MALRLVFILISFILVVSHPSGPCTFNVQSVDHQYGKDGEYFNFYVSDINKILKGMKWDAKVFNTKNSRTGKIDEVIIWDHTTGGSIGDGHGRKEPYDSRKPGDYRKGDQITFVGIDCYGPSPPPTPRPTKAPTTPKPTPRPTGPTPSPTPKPTPKPTKSPTLPETIPMLSRGYNLFKNELSGSNILDPDYLVNNTEYVTTAGSTCKYSSLEFQSAFSSYEAYAISDSESISAGFSTEEYGAAGAVSVARTKARENARSSQSSIYSISLECVVMTTSTKGVSALHWNQHFVEALDRLPRSYQSGDGFSDYIDFWDDYGTHVLLTAKLGGSIRGSVVSDKCSIYESYGTTSEYEVCLNGEYKGVETEGCKGGGKESFTSSTIESTIKNKQIEVRGGDTNTFSDIFQSFGDKKADFSDWIKGLYSEPYVIGGNTNEIHDVIDQAARSRLSGHRLGLEDNDISNIARAMKAAFRDYAAEIEKEQHLYELGECSVECMDGLLDAEKCICQNCEKECCGSDATKLTVNYGVFFLFVFYVYTQL